MLLCLVSMSACAPSSLGGKLLDVWNRGGNVLIWGLQFEVGEIIWGLKFRGLRFAIFGLKFGVGKSIWGLIFLVCHCPSSFLMTKFF